MKKYYAENKERFRGYNKRQRQRRAEFVDSFKKWCANCGYYKCKRALGFHHPNDDKVVKISEMSRQGLSEKSIKDEIDKCVVLCANCHAEVHCDK